MSAPNITDEVRSLCETGRYDDATQRTLQTYGGEILGLLVALAPDEATAGDAYSLFCERLWNSLSAFRFESSIRTWAYVVARRSLADVRRAQGRGPKLVVVSPSKLPDAIDHVRSTTRPHLKTTHKDALAALRSELSEEDQLLLVLRLDRDLSWPEVARVLSEDPEADDAELRRATVALRKRFQRAKERLAAKLTGRLER